MKVFDHSAQSNVWQNPNTTYYLKHLMHTVKHSGGGVIVLLVLQLHAVIKLTMNPSVCKGESNRSGWPVKATAGPWNKTIISNSAANLRQKKKNKGVSVAQSKV